MSSEDIYVNVVRPGKETKTVSVTQGVSVEAVFIKAGIEAELYRSWTITNERGETLGLGSTLHETTKLVCGGKVDGAA